MSTAFKINVHNKARDTLAIASEANPVTLNRDAIGALAPFVAKYTPYTAGEALSVDGVMRAIAAPAGPAK
jgi:hypothetical protein